MGTERISESTGVDGAPTWGGESTAGRDRCGGRGTCHTFRWEAPCGHRPGYRGPGRLAGVGRRFVEIHRDSLGLCSSTMGMRWGLHCRDYMTRFMLSKDVMGVRAGRAVPSEIFL